MCFHPDLGISLLFHHFFHGAHFHCLLVKSSVKTLWPSKLSWVFRLLAVAPGPHEDFNIQPSIHKLTFVQILFTVFRPDWYLPPLSTSHALSFYRHIRTSFWWSMIVMWPVLSLFDLLVSRVRNALHRSINHRCVTLWSVRNSRCNKRWTSVC